MRRARAESGIVPLLLQHGPLQQVDGAEVAVNYDAWMRCNAVPGSLVQERSARINNQ